MRRQIRSTTTSSSPRIAAIEPGFLRAASAIASPRSELTHGMADDEVGLQAALPDRRQDGEARRDERRLLHLRLDKLFLGRAETQSHEIDSRSFAPAFEDLRRLGDPLGDLPAHAGLQRALAREAEGDETTAAHAVHSIKPDPHVSPAPIPVINTRLPFSSRPSFCASAKASGIEPEDVLP